MIKVEFNNGFVTAIALFLEHKNRIDMVARDTTNGTVISDNRLYTGADHLYDLEIPKSITKKYPKLANRIRKAKKKVFQYRLDTLKNTKIADKLFKEFEDILAQIDYQIFKTKRVVMRYR